MTRRSLFAMVVGAFFGARLQAAPLTTEACGPLAGFRAAWFQHRRALYRLSYGSGQISAEEFMRIYKPYELRYWHEYRKARKATGMSWAEMEDVIDEWAEREDSFLKGSAL